MARHRPDEREGRTEVVLVVRQRLFHALADRFEPCKVDDRVDPLLGKELLGLVGVELEKLSTMRTSCPAPTSWMTVCEPMYPAPPLTRTRMRTRYAELPSR